MIETLKPLINKFIPFAQKKMGFKKPPRLFLRKDPNNAKNPLGKTAYYDPEQMSVTLYISGRHPKDIMRSLSHELVHHTQNCNGMFSGVSEMGEGYAQNDDHLREMEREAYEQGNLCFRDWEDGLRETIYFEHLQKGVNTKMSTKKWKDNELKGLLTEKWGFSMDLSKLSEGKKPDGDGDGVPPWADKDDKDADVQEEGIEEPGKKKGKCPKCKKEPCKCKEKELDEAHCGGKRDDDVIVSEESDDAMKHEKCKERCGSPIDGSEGEGYSDCIEKCMQQKGMKEVAASSGRKSPHADRRGDDERKRPMQEAVLRERIKKMLKNVKFKK
tara:strand:+ start:8173 stop:9156 length:984 start_codon:yes stop_codon:yes gene_type:complete